jgi:hypothetical protein
MLEGRLFYSRCHSAFQMTESFQPNFDLKVDSTSNRNEYQESS